MTSTRYSHHYVKPAATLLFAVSLLVGCDSNEQQDTGATPGLFSMSIPDSMTGGASLASKTIAAKAGVALAASGATDVPCSFLGSDDEDLFRNGYEMTKFMVSVVATWTCVADNAIILSDHVANDGAIVATDNSKTATAYDPEEPTHYSVSADSVSQSTIRLYYDYAVDLPPTISDLPGVYLSWDEAENGDVQGKLIIDITGLAASNIDPEDPIAMRLDFDNNSSRKLANMVLLFDTSNQWADGFRVEVVKDLTMPANQQVFTARGLLSMKGQFLPANGVTEVPTLKMFTVSDAFGGGAAIAQFDDIALPLEINTQNNMGNYIFSKRDKYFFDANQKSAKPWDWIFKTIIRSEYRGGRTTALTGGTFEPLDPSLDIIIAALGLDENYFTASQCGDLNSSCDQFLDAVFADGFAGQEMNQGSEPDDWRVAAIQAATSLDSVLPVGDSWDTVFNQEFTPK
ncbi:MAG: hypothetical protein ACC707_05125 [Thiohalomonadales bacterium]